MSSTTAPESIQLGNLVALAYDRAATLTSDPERLAEVATFTVTQWLRRMGKLHLVRLLATDIGLRATRAAAHETARAA